MLMIRRKKIQYYCQRLARNDYFALAGYSDAEWYCILGVREGSTTGLGQKISLEHGRLLLDILHRRHLDRKFLIACPACIEWLPATGDGLLEKFLEQEGLRDLVLFERDMILDDLAREAGLNPFIRQLRKMKVVLIGNAELRKATFLKYRHFVPVSSPNLHLEPDGIENAVQNALDFGQRAVYLVSAGVSAAIIIDRLYEALPTGFFMDCGSIWDAFVGIGEQRAWRAELYADKRRYNEWLSTNLRGV